MRHSLSLVVGFAVLAFSLTGVAGDCNNTVMGGGCSGQTQGGVSPHMQSQNPMNAVTKIKSKANSGAKVATPAKNVKVSNAKAQKPQI